MHVTDEEARAAIDIWERVVGIGNGPPDERHILALAREALASRVEIEHLRQTTTDALASLAKEVALARVVIAAARDIANMRGYATLDTLIEALRAYDAARGEQT